MKTYTMAMIGLALAGAQYASKAQAEQVAPADESAHPASGISEISDEELGDMRGRYTVGGNSVAWFGVSMTSSWQTQGGQTLQSTLKLGMDFSNGKQKPVITFQPVVNITQADAPIQVAADGSRSVDGAGLANVNGMVQSVQVAGDGNRAANVTLLNVRNGDAPPAGEAVALSGDAASVAASQGGALAQASVTPTSAGVLLQIEGFGAVRQWIGSGSLGQTIQLSGDHQQVSNQLELTLVRQSVRTDTGLQNVAQAIGYARGVGPSGF